MHALTLPLRALSSVISKNLEHQSTASQPLPTYPLTRRSYLPPVVASILCHLLDIIAYCLVDASPTDRDGL